MLKNGSHHFVRKNFQVQVFRNETDENKYFWYFGTAMIPPRSIFPAIPIPVLLQSDLELKTVKFLNYYDDFDKLWHDRC